MIRAIAYKEGYKYQLENHLFHKLPEAFKDIAFEHYWFSIENCVLIVRKGYAWDGPSGPTWDTKTGMRGSAVHDPLYQAMQLGLIPQNAGYKKAIDEEFYRILVEDKMWKFRAWYWYKAVQRKGRKWTLPGSGKKVIYAGIDYKMLA